MNDIELNQKCYKLYKFPPSSIFEVFLLKLTITFYHYFILYLGAWTL